MHSSMAYPALAPGSLTGLQTTALLIGEGLKDPPNAKSALSIGSRCRHQCPKVLTASPLPSGTPG